MFVVKIFKFQSSLTLHEWREENRSEKYVSFLEHCGNWLKCCRVGLNLFIIASRERLSELVLMKMGQSFCSNILKKHHNEKTKSFRKKLEKTVNSKKNV